MHIFDQYRISWLESFELLSYESLKMLLLVSVKTLVSAYRSLLYAWFLPVTLVIGLVLTIPRLLAAFYISLIVRATRSSLPSKDSHYWQERSVADWIVFLFMTVVGFLPHIFVGTSLPLSAESLMFYLYESALKIFFIVDYLWIPGADQLSTFIPFLSPFLILWLLFFYDAQKTYWAPLEAARRSLSMLVHNYPFLFVSYACMRLLLSCGYACIAYLGQGNAFVWSVALLILLILAVPYWICFITNFYIKRMHEQFSLYYEK